MAYILPIVNELIPYDFDILLSGNTYKFGIKYNTKHNILTVSLEKNDIKLVDGEKLVLGNVLFEAISHDTFSNRNNNFFNEILVPFDFSGKEEDVNINNLGKSCFIWVGDRT